MLKLYGYHAMPWNATLGAYIVAQSGQPWESWSYEPYIAARRHEHERHDPLRGTGRLEAHGTVALADGPELHAQPQARPACQCADRGGPVQRVQPSRPATTRNPACTARSSDSRATSTIRAASRSRPGCSSKRASGSGLRVQARSPGPCRLGFGALPEQPLSLNQHPGRRICLLARELNARGLVGLVQEHAHLRALEEGHRIFGM